MDAPAVTIRTLYWPPFELPFSQHIASVEIAFVSVVVVDEGEGVYEESITFFSKAVTNNL